jgi:mono/diheme cytochrome c family protein
VTATRSRSIGRRAGRMSLWALIAVMAVAVLIQLVPYGRAHRNPAVRQEPPWDSAETRALAVRACFDCHSNETEWPWYSSVAPLSWLIQRDVDEGRDALNYSEWDRRQEEAAESAKTVRDGEMPLWFYPMIQSKARLEPAEREALIRGLSATFGDKDGKGRRERGQRRSRH